MHGNRRAENANSSSSAHRNNKVQKFLSRRVPEIALKLLRGVYTARLLKYERLPPSVHIVARLLSFLALRRQPARINIQYKHYGQHFAASFLFILFIREAALGHEREQRIIFYSS